MSLKNKKVAVLGFGIEGESVARFLLREKAQLFVFCEKEVENALQDSKQQLENRGVIFRSGPFPDLSSFASIFRSPGIRPDISVLVEAKKKNIPVTSSTILFFERCPCPIIGVTATKGKGTTSSLIYEMLLSDKRDVFLGGNIGTPPLDFLDKLNPSSIVVLELSSFQLWDCPYSPHLAVIGMVTVDHLDVHLSEAEYLEAKSQIVLHQKDDDTAIVNADYPNSTFIGEKRSQKRNNYVHTSTRRQYRPGCYVVDNEDIVYDDGMHAEVICRTNDIFIPGKHNWENVCSAVATVKKIGCSNEAIIKTIKTFKGLPHRLELVGEINGVKYYDDSFSTTPDTAIAAISAFTQSKVLILGGSSKGADFTELGNVINHDASIRAIIGIGDEWKKIKEKFQVSSFRFQVVEGCKDMQEIIDQAQAIAKPGDVVLLSPGCASFGMFKNYKDRGEQFKKEVLNRQPDQNEKKFI